MQEVGKRKFLKYIGQLGNKRNEYAETGKRKILKYQSIKKISIQLYITSKYLKQTFLFDYDLFELFIINRLNLLQILSNKKSGTTTSHVRLYPLWHTQDEIK